MQAGEYKTLLSTLFLPPAGPLIVAVLGLMLLAAKRRALGVLLTLLGGATLWLLSCHAVAIALAQALLPQLPAVTPQQLRAAQVEAVVVLGGGVLPRADEYGQPQPSAYTLSRLRYGIWLARRTDLPLAFSGGIGWSAIGMATVPEAEVARQVAKDDFGITLRWAESGSRDTGENARQLGELLQRDRIRRIALVTDAWHLPRAVREFERAGFAVTPAPTGLAVPRERRMLEWLPSAHGLMSSRQVVREWLAIQVVRVSS